MPISLEALDIEQIKSTTACKQIHYFESINSTNSWLLENGECGEICIAETQSAGRGRRGNTWVSEKGGNIYFSQCWCFDNSIEHLSLLGLVMGVAVAEALDDIGIIGHGVKWPNDIFYQNKKLGGILLETKDQSGKVVIGIGLNVISPSSAMIDQPIISINDILGEKVISRNRLIIHIIERLTEKLNQFHALKFRLFLESWKRWDILQGKQVSFDHQGSNIVGEVVEINKHGCLGILNNTGRLSFYSSADIKLAKRREGE